MKQLMNIHFKKEEGKIETPTKRSRVSSSNSQSSNRSSDDRLDINDFRNKKLNNLNPNSIDVNSSRPVQNSMNPYLIKIP